MDNPTPATPDQIAQRLRALAADIEVQAFPRKQMADGFRLMAELLSPADDPADTTGQA